MASPLPAGTAVLSIGLDPGALDYATLPGVDEATLVARVERGNAELRTAGFNVVHCLVGTSPDAAEAQIRSAVSADGPFGLAMIGGGVRMMPEHTELFERAINVLVEVSPGIRLCFNTAPDNTVVALRRHLVSGS